MPACSARILEAGIANISNTQMYVVILMYKYCECPKPCSKYMAMAVDQLQHLWKVVGLDLACMHSESK